MVARSENRPFVPYAGIVEVIFIARVRSALSQSHVHNDSEALILMYFSVLIVD